MSLPVTVTLRTALPVTKSRPVLGSMTFLRAVVTSLLGHEWRFR